MIVFHIDNPPGGNTGWYRIGAGLDPTGNITKGWSKPKQVGGYSTGAETFAPSYRWFGGESQGGGICIRDITGSGRPDLIIFHIDNPPGGNTGWYRIGYDVMNDGNLASWVIPI